MIKSEFTIEDTRKLLAAYAPDWAESSIRPVASSGTDNLLFLLNDGFVLRIPSRPSAVEPLIKELHWLPKLGNLPLAVPEVVLHGKTRSELGFDFGILRWLNGSVAGPGNIIDAERAAEALAHFLLALRDVATNGAPYAGPKNNNRGAELAKLSSKTIASIEALADEIQSGSALDLWHEACSVPFTGQRPVWIHGDLKADNLLSQNGQLTGVIDWGLSAVGDPALDIAAAWNWIEPEARGVFRSAGKVDDATWQRAQGWALYCAVIALSYYRHRSHKALCEQSRRTIQMLGLSRC